MDIRYPICAALAVVTAISAHPALAGARPAAASLTGVWRTDGYGQDVRIDGRHLTTYDTTPVNCVADAHGTATGTSGATTRFAVPDDDSITIRRVSATTAIEHVESATSVRVLHRVAALPNTCSATPDRDPRSVFDDLWWTFARNYPFAALHGVDWRAAYHRFRPQITATTTSTQLGKVVTRMLAPLHDAHVALLDSHGVLFHEVRPGTPDATPQLDARLRHVVTTVDLPLAGRRDGRLTDYAQGRISYTTLDHRIGYLRISGFAGYTDADADTESANRAELDRALRAIFTASRVRGWRGLMIDLRVNGGGSDRLALDVAGRLTSHPYEAYAKQYRHGSTDRVQWSRPQPSYVQPADGPVFTGPVTLLMSAATESAGETFTQALLGRRPAVSRVGENTQGVFSDTLDRPLPNGWELLLPNERYLTSSGASFDGRGIAPTIREPLRAGDTRDPLFAAAYRTEQGQIRAR